MVFVVVVIYAVWGAKPITLKSCLTGLGILEATKVIQKYTYALMCLAGLHGFINITGL